jgi:hypothetical protein
MVINAVASGAVLRALDKRNGPSRQARCSYGLLRLEPQDPEGRKGSMNAFTKDKWLRTIYWVVQKVWALDTLPYKSANMHRALRLYHPIPRSTKP